MNDSPSQVNTDVESIVDKQVEPNIAVKISDVDVLFGNKAALPDAIALLDAGVDRKQILEQTGVVLAVAGASLEVPTGSISVLMGLSGSGKSSLLRCVNGLNKTTRGSLHVQTDQALIDVASCGARQLKTLRRHHLAMVFQQFGLLPWATVSENIGFGLSVRGERRATIAARVQEQLTLVGLDAWADKRIDELSGGMQQRVGLARAFATDAEILLMDEPFSALDPLIREHLQDELLMLQEKLKKTILFVSHDLDEALKLGNQISIMDEGRIVQTGTVEDIVFNPGNDYVRRFAANINPLSVLRARHVMHAVSIDDASEVVVGKTKLTLEHGKPVACHVAGRACELVANETIDELGSLSNSMVIVGQDTPVKALMARAATTVLSTLVVDEMGSLCGVIQSQDLCAALSGR